MTRACALGTNNFEKERDTFFQTFRHYRRLELYLFNPKQSRRQTSDVLVISSTLTKLHSDAVIFTHRWNFRCYFDVIHQW